MSEGRREDKRNKEEGREGRKIMDAFENREEKVREGKFRLMKREEKRGDKEEGK